MTRAKTARRLVPTIGFALRLGVRTALAGVAALSVTAAGAQTPFSMTGGASGGSSAAPPADAPPAATAPVPLAPLSAAPVATPPALEVPTPAPLPRAGDGGAGGALPFSMGGTQPSPAPGAPAGGGSDAGQSAAQPAAAPGTMPPPVSFGVPGSPAPVAPAPAVSASDARAVAPPRGQPGAIARYVLSRPDTRLTGEIDAVSNVVYISEGEVRQQASFWIGFKNSVVVMPESSRMRVTINGRPVMEVPIRSADAPEPVQVPIPPGVLKVGPNVVRIESSMRHRVDCSIGATYELWADLDPAMTGISFAEGEPAVNGLADLPSIGIDAVGATRIFAVRAGNDDPVAIARQLKAVQALSIAGRFDHPVVATVDSLADVKPAPGVMALVVGTAAEVGQVTDVGTATAATQPVAAFLDDGETGVPTLVLSGPASADVDAALERLSALARRSTALYRTDGQGPWRAPDVPIFTGGESRTLRELGVPTSEFSGRHFKVQFDVGLPPDFYANAYGHADLRLDAAYSPEVKPGSTLTVYVNDQVAIVFNLTAPHGDLLDQRLIRVPMQSFRPGANTIRIEANLNTDSDQQCLPGTTYNAQERFVLFNTSRVVLPVYARIGILPNLAALAASAFPYDLDNDQPLPVYVPGGRSASGAASTLLARLAVSRGQSLPIAAASAAAQFERRSALIVSAAPDIDGSLLRRSGLTSLNNATWINVQPKVGDAPGITRDSYEDVLQQVLGRRQEGEQRQPQAVAAAPPDATAQDDTREIYQRWRDETSGSVGLGRVLQTIVGWTQHQFGLSVDMFDLGFNVDPTIVLPQDTLAVIAQSTVPNTSHAAWTLVTAPTDAALAAGVEGLTAPQTWRTLTGRVDAYQRSAGTIVSFATTNVQYFETVPFSLNNARLIAANWFSMNIVAYAAFLFFATSLLGALTWLMIVFTREDHR
ncbi:cellulose biosynthesis cyclic di-GMP-binding regulatory protein BcsB [Segnochrobactrum spirostomi]|nr:cellulose biosynthesis cyclic di-GMP-binding regulatory protein BcsB [Segnochrobactrum spirostomi]